MSVKITRWNMGRVREAVKNMHKGDEPDSADYPCVLTKGIRQAIKAQEQKSEKFIKALT